MVDVDDGERSRKAIIAVMVLVIIGASFYLGFYIGRGNADSQSAQSIQALSPILLITSPDGGAEDRIIELISSANNSIDVEMYSFTNLRLANALIDAKKRGVYVRVIFDPGQAATDDSKQVILLAGGVDVRKASSSFKITHSKIMVVDGRVMLVGSHNWSLNAMFYNREVSVILHDANLALQLEDIFNSDWGKSSDWSQKG